MWMKYSVSLGAAVVLGLVIFTGMQVLIATEGAFRDRDRDQPRINFVRVDPQQNDVETKDRREPEEPPEPDDPPETPDANVDDSQVDNQTELSMDMPNMDMPARDGGGPSMEGFGGDGGSGGGGGFDSDVIPTVKVPPNYPQRAKQASLEGYVTMAVSIRADGTVSDVEVLESEPPRLFDRAAVQAMQRWRFRPKTVDGEPQPQKAKQTMEFNLGE